MLKGNPCKITDIYISPPGKRRVEAASIVGRDIFTDIKYEDSMPTDKNIFVPDF